MSKFIDMISTISAKSDEIKEARDKFNDELKATFQNISKEFFEEFPMVQTITWNQFTPFFNDGDPCVFSMSDIQFVVDGFDEDDLMNPYSYEDTSAYTGDIDDAITRYVGYAAKASSAEYRKNYEARIDVLTKQKEQWPNLANGARIFETVLYSNEDVMAQMFGDGVSVYLTKDRIITEEYDHD